MAKRSLDIVIGAKDRTKGAFASADKGMAGLGRRMLSLRNIAIAGIGIYAIRREITQGVKAFGDFEQQLNMVSTMLQEPETLMPGYAQGIRELSVQFGEGTDALSKGLYDLLSASIAPGQALEVLTIATKAAKGGMTDTAVAVDGITSVLNAFQMSADRAEHVADVMFQTVQRGKITFPELASNIGKVAPIARSAGMSMEDMMAALATMTRQGLSAEEAVTRLVAIIKKAPNEVRNLSQLVSRFLGKSLSEIQKHFPEIRAAAGIAALSADIAGFRLDLDLMGRASGRAGEAFAKMAGGAAYESSRLRAAVKDLRVSLGEALMPAVTAVTKYLQEQRAAVEESIKGFGKWVAGTVKWVAANRELLTGLGKTAVALTAVLIIGPPLIAVIKGIGVAAMFLVTNPLVLLAVAIGACAAAFLPWEEMLKRIGREARGAADGVEALAVASLKLTEYIRDETTEMRDKAARLAELKSSQKLSKDEMTEALVLTAQLTRAYPGLADEISRLGETARETADAMAAMRTEAAKKMERAQWSDWREEIENLAGELVIVRRHMGRQRGAAERFAAAGKTENETLLRYLENVARAKELQEEIARMEAAGPPVTGPAPAPGIFGKLGRGFTSGMDVAGMGMVRPLGGGVPEYMRPEYQEKNAALLANIRRVTTQGIADDLERQTELIKLSYADRFEAARKAGQDISLVERAMNMEIAQARQKAENKQAEDRLAQTKSLYTELNRLAITATEEGLEERLAMLKLEEKEELALAKDADQRRLIQQKYVLLALTAQEEAEEAERAGRAGPVSIAAVERGFLTRAPGQYDPYKEAEKQQRRIANNTSLAAKAGQEALSILGEIAEKLGLRPAVADF